MSTRSKEGSPPSCESETSKHRTFWTPQDERALVEAIHAQQPRAGDEVNFRPEEWSAIAAKMGDPLKGARKTGESCKTKWTRVSQYASNDGLS